jgi:hypothetical protein
MIEPVLATLSEIHGDGDAIELAPFRFRSATASNTALMRRERSGAVPGRLRECGDGHQQVCRRTEMAIRLFCEGFSLCLRELKPTTRTQTNDTDRNIVCFADCQHASRSASGSAASSSIRRTMPPGPHHARVSLIT